MNEKPENYHIPYPSETTDEQIKKAFDKAEFVWTSHTKYLYACRIHIPTEEDSSISVDMLKLAEIIDISDDTLKSIFVDRGIGGVIDDYIQRGYLNYDSYVNFAKTLNKTVRVQNKMRVGEDGYPLIYVSYVVSPDGNIEETDRDAIYEANKDFSLS